MVFQLCFRTSLALMVICGPPPSLVSAKAQGSRQAEYHDKANFISTFPGYVEWPNDAFPSEHAPLLICVLGSYPFGTSLAELTQSEVVRGRPVQVRWIRAEQGLRSCHILFVSHSEEKCYARILQSVQGAPVLTVGETPGFLDAGGAVNFLFHHDTLRFEVNLAAAGEAHLKISSRLLVLATRVINKLESGKS